MTLPVVAPPSTTDELLRALALLHGDSVEYWTGYPDERFFAPIGEAWSSADHVRHLTTSMRAVTRGLRMPRPVVWLAFGPARGPSRGYDAIRATYREALARGGRATGPYVPRPLTWHDHPAAARARIMERHAAAVRELATAVRAWPERALDRHRLPHPLLGKLTVREMLNFTLYHNLHHVHGAARRAAEAGGAAAG